MTYRQLIGTKYEYYVLEHIKKDFDKVWHWCDFPERNLYELNLIKDYDKFKKYRSDIGADLVALKNNKYYFIQCKNFKETIYIDTLAGFYFLLYENNLNGILYYNGSLSERLVDLSTGKIPFINLPFNNENLVLETESCNELVIRDYQLEAYNKLKGLNNCILSLPCSMGKTFISSMLGKDYDNILIMSPTRALAQQNLEKFKEYLKNSYNYILISMDGKRKLDDICKILRSRNVISSTYDSCNIVNSLISKLDNWYIIIDEFHNLSINNTENNSNEINKLLTANIKKVFVSATPIEGFMNITNDNIYTYRWDDAIKNKYICDINIYLPNINQEFNNFIDVIKNNYNVDELKLIRKAYSLVKSMLYNGDKKCICYLTTIDKANIFNKVLSLISTTLNVEIEREQIDCNTKRLKRNEIIEKFKKSTKLFILLNVHVLDEGIDIPECDSVYITQPNYNIANIVQRICRANRINKHKTECNVYLWCTEKKTNDILNYLFGKTQDSFRSKVFKISKNNNQESTRKYTTPITQEKVINTTQFITQTITNKSQIIVEESTHEGTTTRYTCKVCNNLFKTSKSLWNHNKKYHTNVNTNDGKNSICKYCNTKLSDRKSRWRHEKTCVKNQLIAKVNKASNQRVDSEHNNHTKPNINSIGFENIKGLTDDQVKQIFSTSGINMILDYVNTINFNKAHSENHSFCITNINSKHLKVYNNETKTITLKEKKYHFRELLDKVIVKIVDLFEYYYNNEYIKSNHVQIKNNIEFVKKLIKTSSNSKDVKDLMDDIEVLSYNRKDMVINTWKSV